MKFDFGSLPARIGKALQGVFGSANQRALAKYLPIVKAVNALADEVKALSQEQIRAQVAAMREQVKSGETTLDDVLPRMFALTREAATRTLGIRHFDVQLIGGAVLHQGKIAEMATGEGKTLVATLPAALNAIAGKGVFVVTVNDYLAKRDRDWMAPVYEYLGLTVGAIQSSMPPQERHTHYACDITYGTNNEFGFDYLRDNMKWRAEEQVQKHLAFAIVDEVDSILIDEARTPLIISGEGEGSTERYVHADRVARQLKEGVHFEIKLKEHQCLLTDEGVVRAEQLVGVDSFYSDPQLMEWPHLLETSLRAHHVYERDKHYVVAAKQAQDGKQGDPEVIIVDEFTGRLMPGRRWSDGLHQAVEAKEGITPREETRTFATITLQNYFRMFGKLAGMTGTAMTEAAEFSNIYNLDVVAIPTNRPMVRKDFNDQVYLDGDSKYDAIAAEIQREHARGRPILLGTTSIAKSEAISERLKKLGIKHEVLNAKQHAREADIVMQAGRRSAVTVATNMAGRGTDIVLGGKADALWRSELAQKGWQEGQPEAQARLEELRQQCTQEHDEILRLGGLYVIGSERHEARRIDNQLRGRCGRQGDPGETRFFLSFDDDLMKIFARDWVKVMMEKMGLKSGEVIDSPMVTRGIAKAQRKVEARNFDVRKNLLEYDEVMDKQRKFVYAQRQEALLAEGLRDKVLGMFEAVLEPTVERCAGDKDQPIDFAGLRKWLQHRCGDALDLAGLEQVERDALFDWCMQRVETLFDQRKELYGEADWSGVQRFLLIDTIDAKWKDHLHAIEVLKAGVGMRSYAQIDPKNEFKKEGYEKFQQLKLEIAEQVTSFLFKQEATDTIRDMITGRLRAQAPRPAPAPAPVAMPRSAQELMEVFEQLVAQGQVPDDIVQRVRSGELEVIATPQGISVRPLQPAPGAPGAPRPRTPEELKALFEQLVAENKVPAEVVERVRKGELELVETPQGITAKPVGQAAAPQQAQPPMPKSRAEAEAIFESMIAAGQVPKEIAERVKSGELEVWPSPNGLELRPSAAAQAAMAAQAKAQAPAAPAAGSAAPAAASAGAKPAAATLPAAGKPAAARPANAPKPGRNDPCPCGSGIKYKKCCAPAFDG